MLLTPKSQLLLLFQRNTECNLICHPVWLIGKAKLHDNVTAMRSHNCTRYESLSHGRPKSIAFAIQDVQTLKHWWSAALNRAGVNFALPPNNIFCPGSMWTDLSHGLGYMFHHFAQLIIFWSSQGPRENEAIDGIILIKIIPTKPPGPPSSLSRQIS